jgi:hypothetical protein
MITYDMNKRWESILKFILKYRRVLNFIIASSYNNNNNNNE